MTTKYLDSNGLQYLLSALRPSTAPADLGTASAGSSKQFAKADHVHKKPTASDVGAASSSHTHGNITNGGALQSTDITIANGDKLVVTDSSNSNKVARASLSFDGSTTTTALTPKGTFESFSKFSGSYNDLSDKPTIPSLKNVFGKVKVGSTTIEADTTQDTLEISENEGLGIYVVPDATNDKVTINTTTRMSSYSSASTLAGGVMNFKYKPSASATEDTYNVYDSARVDDYLSKKVDAVSGKGLSENDFTTTLKNKLDGIASGAEVNVNADWNSSSGDSQILNKPTLGTAAAKDTVSSISSDSNNVPTVTAVKNYVASSVTGAVAFQGTAPTTFAPTNYKAGYYWVVGTAGTYCGETCEAGDMIFATADYSSAYADSDFDVVQTNLDITAITNAEIDTIVAA